MTLFLHFKMHAVSFAQNQCRILFIGEINRTNRLIYRNFLTETTMWGRRALLGVTCRWRHRTAAVLSTSRRPSDEDGPLTNDRPGKRQVLCSEPAGPPSVLRHGTIGVASYAALGHVPPPQLPITYFFLPHFGAIKVLSRSLVSNVFRILRTTVIKISLFFVLLKKMKWVYRIFL